MHDGGKLAHNEFSSIEKSSKKEESLFAPLTYLALHKEATIEEMAELSGKNYSTILRATNQLVKNGFVFMRFERTAPKGKELRYYALTFSGLIMYLSKKITLNEIREVAKAHEDMLLVFKKWDKFVAAECEEEIFLQLRNALRFERQRYIIQYSIDFLTAFGRTPQKETSSPLDFFDSAVLGLIFMDQPIEYVKESLPEQWKVLQKIWQVIEKDYELRKKRDEFLSYLEREHNEGLKAIAEWNSYVKQEHATKA
jgi:hypothetical protein